MSTTKLRSDMIEYIGIDDKVDLLQGLIDDRTTSNKQLPCQNGNSSNETHSQKNGLHISSEEMNGSYSTRNGLSHDHVEIETAMLKHTSRVLDKVNILNGDSSKNGFQSESVEDCPEKFDTNGLDMPHDEMNVVKGIIENGENVEDKIRMIKHLEIYTGEPEKLTNPLSISSTSRCFIKRDETLQKRVTLVDNANRQKEELRSDSKILALAREVGSDQDEYRSSGDESVAGKGKPIKQEGFEPVTQFNEQVSQHFNSNEMQSKMKKINNLIEYMSNSSFKQPNPAVVEEIKLEGPDKESEDKSKPEDVSTFPKRKSKQSDFEDPEELQLLAKKLKMSMIEDNVQEPSSEESQRYLSEQFRLAYEGFFEKVSSGHNSKAFNFAENSESPKTKLAKEHLNEIADRVLNAMSLDRCFLPKEIDESILRIEEHDLDGIAKTSQYDFINQFTPAVYDFERLGKDFYPLVCLSPNEIQTRNESSSKSGKYKETVVVGSSSSSVQDGIESSAFSRARLETNDRLACKMFEMFKIVVSLGCLFPFLIITYMTAKLLNVCFPKDFSKGSKTLSRHRKVNDEAPK